MPVVFSLSVIDHPPAWRLRLLGDDFRQPPWLDADPNRLALESHLPAELLRLARVIDRLVDHLCLQDLVASFSSRGSPAHRPDLLLKAVLFFTQRGVHSPAEWARQCKDSLVARWLLRGILPGRARCYAFRKRCSSLIDDLNRQLLHQAIDDRLIDDDAVAVFDGTFVAANSSRHVLLNDRRLRGRLQTLHAAVAADEKEQPQQQQEPPATSAPSAPSDAASSLGSAACAPATDLATPLPAAPAPAPGWMARTAAGRQSQRRRYLKAAEQLCQRLERNRKRRKEDRKPDDKVLISLGDPEAILGLDKEKVYRPLFNVQLASDLKTDFCLGYGVFATTQDGETLVPMLSRVGYFTGRKLERAVTDAGYASGANLRETQRSEVELIAPYQENDYSKKKAEGKGQGKKPKQMAKSEFRWDASRRLYVCPQGKELKHKKTQTRQKREGATRERQEYYQGDKEQCRECLRRGECTTSAEGGRMVMRGEYEEEVEKHKERMSKDETKALYKKRKEQIERRIADGKEHRGLRKLSMRGLQGTRTQVGLLALVNNAVIFDKLQQRAAEAACSGQKQAVPQPPPTAFDKPRTAPDKVSTLSTHLL